MIVNNAQTNSGTTWSTTPSTVSVMPKIIKQVADNHSFNNEQDYPSMPSLWGYVD